MYLDGRRSTGEYDPELDALLSRIHEAEYVSALHGLLLCGEREPYKVAASDLEGLQAPSPDVSDPFQEIIDTFGRACAASPPCWTLEMFSLDSELVRMNRRIHYRRDPLTSDMRRSDLRYIRCIRPDFPLGRQMYTIGSS
jgi:hypothetical protein